MHPPLDQISAIQVFTLVGSLGRFDLLDAERYVHVKLEQGYKACIGVGWEVHGAAKLDTYCKVQERFCSCVAINHLVAAPSFVDRS